MLSTISLIWGQKCAFFWNVSQGLFLETNLCTVNISCKGNLNLKSLISFEVTTKTLKGTNNRNDGSVAFVIIYREQN